MEKIFLSIHPIILIYTGYWCLSSNLNPLHGLLMQMPFERISKIRI